MGSRTVRNIISWVQPVVSKHLIDLSSNMDCSEHETVIDHIIYRLESTYPTASLMILITPSSKHQHLYKLHVIDRNKSVHLGMTSITCNELDKLKNSITFNKYPFVFGTRYLDLQTVALNSETIGSLVKTLNGKCCKAWNENHLHLLNRRRQTNERNRFVNKATSTTMIDGDLDVIPIAEQPANQNITKISAVKKMEERNYKLITENYIKNLMKTISSNMQPLNEDVERFFSIVECLKFKIILRPDFSCKSLKAPSKSLDEPIRFFLECYMPLDNYMGSLALDMHLLKMQLLSHPNLLNNIRIVDDVFELVPLPVFFIRFIRNLCLYFSTEMILDMLGEFVYHIYLVFRNFRKKCNFFNSL